MSEEVLALLVELFQSVAQSVAVVVFMILVGERLVRFFEPIATPVLSWLQGRLAVPDGWVMMVFSWLVVGAVVAAAEVNIFAPFIPRPWIGRVLTVIFCGGGSNMLHDVWPMPRTK
jgi:hypothetical protein